MEQVLELREQLQQLAIIEEMMFGVLNIFVIEFALTVLYTWRISTTTN